MTVVLDASAMLALLLNEPGRDRVLARIAEARIGLVNHVEVLTRLMRRGEGDAGLSRYRSVAAPLLVPLDEDQAFHAARLLAPTRDFGLSLGDRCCLALGAALGAPVLTADRIWAGIDVGVAIEVIR